LALGVSITACGDGSGETDAVSRTVHGTPLRVQDAVSASVALMG
jgi:hypothetical protein